MSRDFNRPLPSTTTWSTQRVDELISMVDEGRIELSKIPNPFWEGKPEWRMANIIFEYTPEEMEEMKRCASDPIYFANNYCFSMTDDGVQKIRLRDYQEDVIRGLHGNRMVAMVAPRQCGKTICVGIFLTWYLLFHKDRNLMVMANVGSTTDEIIDKLKVIMSNLPFFMKPGVFMNNVKTMKFDNGCRLFGRNTTKTAAIGFAVHFLYCDEFAHIPANFLEPFWRSVYPTLSSSKVSRCIITSTPNGQNKFYEIYKSALVPKGEEGSNDFIAMRIDWWQVPGRDDEWRKKEIANLGSVEDFNQEFGNQFISSDSLLLDGPTLRSIGNNKAEYRWLELPALEDHPLVESYNDLKWHPKFDPTEVPDGSRFVLSIDIAGGGGGDYTVINVFWARPLPIERFKDAQITEEADAVAFLQVGMFRSNRAAIEVMQPILEALVYGVFGEDNARIVLEVNFQGDLLLERMSNHARFYDDMFVHTKHSENSRREQIGVKYNPKNKFEMCMEMRRLVKCGRIVVTEKVTYDELQAFGRNNKGSYSSQIGHDDAAMSTVTLTAMFGAEQYYEIADSLLESLSPERRSAIRAAVTANRPDDDDDESFSPNWGDLMS